MRALRAGVPQVDSGLDRTLRSGKPSDLDDRQLSFQAPARTSRRRDGGHPVAGDHGEFWGIAVVLAVEARPNLEGVDEGHAIAKMLVHERFCR